MQSTNMRPSWIARVVFPAALCLLFSVAAGPAKGQGPTDEEYARVFQLGYDALENGRLDQAVAAFMRCLQLRPGDALSAYNLACAYSRNGDVDRALQWLERSIEWGFQDFEHIRQDVDLDNIRADPRFTAVVSRDPLRQAPVPVSALVEQTSNVVVMIEGQLGGDETIGAGIIIGRRNGEVYIATANHVVRRGDLEASDLRVMLRALPGTFLPAQLMEHADADLDLAVLSVQRVEDHGIRYCADLPLERLDELNPPSRGDAVYPVGYPNGAPWGIPVAPDFVAQLVGDDVTFQSAFVSPGHSGGALVSERGALVGMIRADTPPFGVAVAIGPILERLRQWEYPVHLRAPSSFVRTPLHAAVEDGDLDEVRRLLDACAYINAVSDAGRTPLHVAASAGRADVTRMLLEAGADVDARTSDPETADIRAQTSLHLAAAAGFVDVASVLVTHGAHVNAPARDLFDRDWEGTPLHRAAANGHVELISLLLDHGADLEASSRDGTPLTVAVKHGRMEAARRLIERGAIVEGSDRSDVPLYVAADSGSVDFTRLLLDAGGDPDVEGSFGAPLHRAARHGYVQIAKLLIGAGADVNVRDTWGSTPLHEAAAAGRLELVELLLDSGADVEPENDRRDRPIDLAGNENVARLLRDRAESLR